LAAEILGTVPLPGAARMAIAILVTWQPWMTAGRAMIASAQPMTVSNLCPETSSLPSWQENSFTRPLAEGAS